LTSETRDLLTYLKLGRSNSQLAQAIMLHGIIVFVGIRFFYTLHALLTSSQ